MSIGINLRVTGHTSIGGRKYQEDFFSVAYQQTENDQSLEYAFFGIYDGHGGAEASLYAKEHLMNTIVSQKLFWSENDEDVLRAIREGYIQTHYSMWREQDKWPKTSSGLPSTAGTTASIAFIRQGKIYVGHVGDSGIVLGFQKDSSTPDDESTKWGAVPLTEDHKPEAYAEKMRIMSCGGKVVTKSGVPRVVWNRPRIGHKGPVRRSTPIDEIPFLAVARSLGDLWSYNSAANEFIVSPNPDVSVIEIDPKKHRCLIFGTDGLWNVLSAKHAVEIVHAAERENIRICLEGGCNWKNPSKLLVNEALERWSKSNMKADNTSVVIIMLDPPGPPKRDVLRSMRTPIQHIDYGPTAAQPANNMNITLFDHTTRELIDLSQMTCQGAPPADNHGSTQPLQYIDPSASASYQDMPYTNSFADSYNSFLNSSLTNDHSYTNYTTVTEQYAVHHPGHQQQQPQHRDSDGQHALQGEDVAYMDESLQSSSQEDTYSLTNLQTKSERLHSEMMEAATSSGSTTMGFPHPSQFPCAGNVAIFENFHDYPLPHLSHPEGDQGCDNQYLQHTFRHDPPTYQMERFDYSHHHQNHQPPQEESMGYSYGGAQNYKAHDLSEQNYQREASPTKIVQQNLFLHTSKFSNEQSAGSVVVETTARDHGSTSENIEAVTVTEQSPPVEVENNTITTRANTEEGIQINEISSSNLNPMSSTLSNPHSDSDSCASGDEQKASSSTSTSDVAAKSRAEIGKGKRNKIKKSFNNIVRIVYETRSQRPSRTRGQQENLKSNSNSKVRNRFQKFMTKNTAIKSLFSYSKVSKTSGYSSADNNNCSVHTIDNAVNPIRDQTGAEKRVLRSADQVKPEQHNKKPVQRARRSVEHNLTNQIVQKKLPFPATVEMVTRKPSRRKVILRKVASRRSKRQ